MMYFFCLIFSLETNNLKVLIKLYTLLFQSWTYFFKQKCKIVNVHITIEIFTKLILNYKPLIMSILNNKHYTKLDTLQSISWTLSSKQSYTFFTKLYILQCKY